jgi:hypothetical protein
VNCTRGIDPLIPYQKSNASTSSQDQNKKGMDPSALSETLTTIQKRFSRLEIIAFVFEIENVEYRQILPI